MADDLIKITVLTSLYKCEEFLPVYFDALRKIDHQGIVEVLLLHNSPLESELSIIAANIGLLGFVKHIIIPEREGLYSTWNRGICMAKGEYVTVWNVDDIRFPHSLISQARALDENPDAVMSYGDMWITTEYGSPGDMKVIAPLWNNENKKKFWKAYHVTCFQMWRKSVHQFIGYYDEQFKCSADFDFQIRVAIHFPLVKTEDALGVYLEGQPHKISNNGYQEMENNIICLRYGNYKNINFLNLSRSKSIYNKDQLLFNGKWTDFSEQLLFSPFSRFFGIVFALQRTVMIFIKQIVKKIVRRNIK